MRILVDWASYETHKSENRGICRYMENIIELLRKDPDISLTFRSEEIPTDEYDIFLIPDLFSIWLGVDNPLLLPIKAKRKIVIVYDWIAPSYNEDSTVSAQIKTRATMLHDCEVLTISDTMKKLLLRKGYKDVTNIGCGVDVDVLDTNNEPFEKRDIILTLGGTDDHKNCYNQNIAIELVKNKWLDVSHFHISAISPHKAYPHCTWLKCNDEEKVKWLRAAKCLVYTSIYEGFGIPPIEALCEHCTPIVSDTPIFHETLGDYGVYVEPLNIEEIRDVIETALLFSGKFLFFNSLTEKINFFDRFNWRHVGIKLINKIKNPLLSDTTVLSKGDDDSRSRVAAGFL